MLQMELQDALGIDLVLGQCRPERDSAQRCRRPPVLEFLGTLAAANAQIVERLRPAAGRKDGIVGVEAEEGRAADLAGPGGVERRPGAGEGRGKNGAQLVRIDADLLARALQGLAQIVDLLGLPRAPCLGLVVHLGDSGLLQILVARLVDFLARATSPA